MAAIDLEVFKNNGRNRWGVGYFELNELTTSTSTERNRQETSEIVASTEESEVERPTTSFSMVDLKDYDIAEKTIHYIQVNHTIKVPKIVNAEANENLKKAKLNFIMDSKTLIHKTSVEPKLLLLKVCLRNT